jgi:hypothetical protein
MEIAGFKPYDAPADETTIRSQPASD